MTWSMLLPSKGDLHIGGTVESFGDTVPGDCVTDTAEYHHYEREERERESVEAGAVAAKCHEGCSPVLRHCEHADSV